ncbi:MAG: hypothetical protein KTR31_33935, partial [Myxococcales bacterium]|nr:hypothetical protein [Myxococcales bacterium]
MIGAWLLAAEALATPQLQAQAALRVNVHLGRTASAVALGGGVGARLEEGIWGVDATVGAGLGMAPVLDTTLGADVSPNWALWRPAVGLEVGALWGNTVRFVDSEDPGNAVRSPVLAGVRVRAHPLVFRADGMSAVVAGLAVGTGLTDPGLNLRIDLLRIGVRL